MNGYSELCQRNPYIFHREARWTDPDFYTREQKRAFDEVYMTFDNIVCPRQYIKEQRMLDYPEYFGESYNIYNRFGLLPLMRLHLNFDINLTAQFYSTVAFRGDNDEDMIWMTRNRKIKASWHEFATLLGYPIEDGEDVNGWKVHVKSNASKPDVPAPL